MYKVKHTKKYGRGLYATEDITANALVASNHVVLMHDSGEMSPYVFKYKKVCALAMGDVSLVNHSDREANCSWYFRKTEVGVMIYLKTVAPVKKGQQLFIDYGYDPSYYTKGS